MYVTLPAVAAYGKAVLGWVIAAFTGENGGAEMWKVVMLVCGVCVLLLVGCAAAPQSQIDQSPDDALLDHGLLGPVKQDGYGLGVHHDATGRPFRWVPQGEPANFSDPLLDVTPNAYGPGIGMDQYGRPVQAVPFQ